VTQTTTLLSVVLC